MEERRVSIDLSKNSIRRHERSNSAPERPSKKLRRAKRIKSDASYLIKKDDYCVELEWSEEDLKENNAHAQIPISKVELMEKSDVIDSSNTKKKKKFNLFKKLKNIFKSKT